MNTANPLHIFRPGRHIASSGQVVEFTAADLAATAAAYDPAKHEAPLVVGHPRVNGPAFGWVASLLAAPEGLFALPEQVETTFAAMVGEGRFKKISASFFLPGAPGNPVPGVHYLRHVGFLGAAEPAVKGLRAVEFAAHGCATIDFSLPEENAVSPEDKAALEAENATLKQQLAAAAQREKDAQAARLHAENADFTARLVNEGRLMPGVAEVLTATLDFLASQEGVVEFAAPGGKKPLGEALKTQLAACPPQIELREVAADKTGADTGVANFVAPGGMAVDAGLLELHRKASAYVAEHKTTYFAAVAAIKGGV